MNSEREQKQEKRRKNGVLLIGCHPQRGGVELILWAINAEANAGDLVIALIVCDPWSSLLTVGESEQEKDYGVERCVGGNKRATVRAQLRELRQLCKQKQIQMDIKFEGGQHPEKVLVEQAKILSASVLVIGSGSSDRFVSWLKRTARSSNYCVDNAPPGCCVIAVKNGKVVHFKNNNQMNASNKITLRDAEASSSLEGTHVSVVEEEPEVQQSGLLDEESSSSSENVVEAHYSVKAEEEKEENKALEYCNRIEGSLTSDVVDVKKQEIQDEKNSSFSPSNVYEVYFDMIEEEDWEGEGKEGCKNTCERTQESSIKEMVNEEETSRKDGLYMDSERRMSTSSSNVFEVFFDVNEDDEEDEAAEGGGGSRTWSEETGRSSPRGVLEGSAAACLDSDSSSPSSNSFSEEKAIVISPNQSQYGNGNENEKGQKGAHWRSILRQWKQGSIRKLSALPQKSAYKLGRSNTNASGKCHSRSSSLSQTKEHSTFRDEIWNFEKHLTDSASKPSWKCFTLKELESATNNFSPENLIGKGGYAEVFKGSLSDGQIVAVKRLNRGKTEEQKVGDFLTELGIIVHINHPNAARLIGFGVEGGLHIILQFSPHGSLASVLHGSNPQQLNWDMRYRVAVGTAKGLLYLHEGCQRRIIHRDIKSSNILLTEEFEPQISDFGLAKWLPEQWKHLIVTPIEGTFGYLAPEYFMHGFVDEKTDVFAFGVLLLELITGRRPIDSSQQNLVMWAKPLIDSRNIRGLVDPSLGDLYDVHQLNYLVWTASLCIQPSAVLRPCMAYVLQLLTGERDVSTDHQRTLTMESLFLEGSSDTEDYTSTRYISDLNRYREIALEL